MAVSVSVIVPCFNAGRWLAECIESVRAQTSPACETIIVDDGSDDQETLDILRSYEGVSGLRVLHKRNGGVSSARNAGLDAAIGEYVLFLDADDYLERDALAVLTAAAAGKSVSVACGGWRTVDESGRNLGCAARREMRADSYVVATKGLPTGGVLTKFRNDVRFNEANPGEAWEALEYFLDYLTVADNAVFVDDVVVNRRQSDRPERLTNKLDHFEPMQTGRFFAGRKSRLIALGAATDERVAALDEQILGCVHRLLCIGRVAEAATLAGTISRNLSGHYGRHRLGSFAWCLKWGGMRTARLFVMINRFLGRGLDRGRAPRATSMAPKHL